MSKNGYCSSADINSPTFDESLLEYRKKVLPEKKVEGRPRVASTASSRQFELARRDNLRYSSIEGKGSQSKKKKLHPYEQKHGSVDQRRRREVSAKSGKKRARP
jgi:hypothetical protein